MNEKATPPSGSRNRQLGTKAAARQAQQKRTRMILVAVVGVVIVVAVLVAILASGGSKKDSATTTVPGVTAESVLASIAAIPAATYDAVGNGAASGKPEAYAGTALTKDGKPELLYLGAEYCPFCAAERWAMVAALSRFGTFTGVSLTTSASEDVYPSTPTFSFYGSTYTSEYLTFTPVETNTNKRAGNGYERLQDPTDAQIAAATESGQTGIPLLLFGGKYFISGATLDPGVLAERNYSGIAQLMADTSKPISQAVLGAANGITAAICGMTGGQPAAVCTSPGVQAAKTALGL